MTDSSFSVSNLDEGAPLDTGGILPVESTCVYGPSCHSPAVAWLNTPVGAIEFYLVLWTVPTTGEIDYNWVLYGIPGTLTQLDESTTIGTKGCFGHGGIEDGCFSYRCACSSGPGWKDYTLTIVALSQSLVEAMGSSYNASAATGNTLTKYLLQNSDIVVSSASTTVSDCHFSC